MTSRPAAAADLALQRGRLLERIATQRRQLGDDLQPLCAALRAGDRAVAGAQAGVAYVKTHPRSFALLLGALLLLRPRRTWRWFKRGFVFWRAWRALRRQLDAFEQRAFKHPFSL